MILITNLLLLFFCILMFYTAHNLKRENYFSHYTKTKLKVKNCDIYTDPALLNEHELNELLKQNPPDCEEGETLYLSSVYPIQRMSVIRCIGTFLPGKNANQITISNEYSRFNYRNYPIYHFRFVGNRQLD